MDARQIIDYAAEDNAKDFRESLYAAIYDKVNAHIEQKKQEVAHNLVTQESKECDGDDKEESHEDEKEDKALVKKMVKKDALKTEEVEEIEEASYSAKAARAGKDIGKPGKQFAKIAAGAAKKYGSEEKGEKVAGAVLAKLRKEETEESLEESVTRKHFQQVADLIKTHDDAGKRSELAKHHAEIFAKQNPRFDRTKFMKAANATE